MSNTGKVGNQTYQKIKTILVSQPKPTHSAFFKLEEKYGLKIDWRQFIQVEPVDVKTYRKTRIKPDEYSAIIFTSKNSIDHFFRMCEELRMTMSQDTKYFCLSEAIANYLQKFIIYRKRKVLVGKRTIMDMDAAFQKHKDQLKFLLPCSNLGSKNVSKYLDDNGFDWTSAMMYQTVSADLSDLDNVTYDVLVFYSPLGLTSLIENFPKFKQNNTRIAVYGKSTCKAVKDLGFDINIKAPEPDVPSMTVALENYLKISNK